MLNDSSNIECDSAGRIKYHPELHFNQGTKWAEEDLEYLCKFEVVDELESVALALGRTQASVFKKLKELRTKGLVEYYKNLNKYW